MRYELPNAAIVSKVKRMKHFDMILNLEEKIDMLTVWWFREYWNAFRIWRGSRIVIYLMTLRYHFTWCQSSQKVIKESNPPSMNAGNMTFREMTTGKRAPEGDSSKHFPWRRLLHYYLTTLFNLRTSCFAPLITERALSAWCVLANAKKLETRKKYSPRLNERLVIHSSQNTLLETSKLSKQHFVSRLLSFCSCLFSLFKVKPRAFPENRWKRFS